jgi:hypothetical protein
MYTLYLCKTYYICYKCPHYNVKARDHNMAFLEYFRYLGVIINDGKDIFDPNYLKIK